LATSILGTGDGYVEVGSGKAESGSRKWGVGSGKSEVGSREAGVGSRKSEVCKAELSKGEAEVGSGKWEVGSGKSEVGSRKSEVYPAERSEDGAEVGSGKWEVGSGAEIKHQKSNIKHQTSEGAGVATSVSPVYKVAAFREKPDRATAEQYLAGGNYLWNAGIFIWRVETLLEAFRRHAEDIHRILAAGAPKYNTPGEQAFIDEAYPTTPSISVDYAIMEKAENVYTIPSSFGWSDLGTWASLHAESDKDAHGNVIQGEKVMAYGVKDSLVRLPNDKLAVLGGLEDYIVVDEGDVLLVWPKSREQEIKKITGEIGEEEYL
ncbi:MAG: mannose-1-phosphate guanylyltransferase, partial [Phaeodactylibacter sp.]|nr:mannose-1-phosphate guanylyltransferase [Phaeodactylibacter sp.]